MWGTERVALIARLTEQRPAPERGQLGQVLVPVDPCDLVEHRAEEVVLGDVGIEPADHLGDLVVAVQITGRIRSRTVSHQLLQTSPLEYF